jgi:hypothetical protein
MKPWFYNEQSITEFKEPVAYKGLNISVSKTKVKPPYIAVVTSPATSKEVLRTGGDTEQAALDSAKQAVDKREADAPKISSSGQTSILMNTPSNDELLKDPTMYNNIYAKISKDSRGPTLVIGNEVYGAADLEADGFVRSYDRRMKKNRDSEEALPQIMFNASNKTLSQLGIKMNGRYTLDTEGKYKDDNEHTVYPLQFQGSTVHAGDKLRMNRPALTIGATREDAQPWFAREAEIIKFPEPVKNVVELPNVQSYPDFLTGVKDLHNRLEKGEISQDSHDRLYADLIQRFMKKESFETPWFLREDATLKEAARGVMFREPGQKFYYKNDETKFLEFQKVLALPQQQNNFDNAEQMEQALQDVYKKIKTNDIHWFNNPTGALAFAIAHFRNEQGQDKFFGKYFRKLTGSPQQRTNIWKNTDFRELGYQLDTPSSRKAGYGLKPQLVGLRTDQAYSNPKQIISEIKDKTFSEPLKSMPGSFPQFNVDEKLEPAVRDDFGEVIGPIALWLGMNLDPATEAARKFYLGKQPWSSCKIIFPGAQTTGLIDSVLRPPAGAGIGISSKGGKGAQPSIKNLRAGINALRKNPTENNKKLLNEYKSAISVIETLAESSAIDGPIKVASERGLINSAVVDAFKNALNGKISQQEKKLLIPLTKYKKTKGKSVLVYHALAGLVNQLAGSLNSDKKLRLSEAGLKFLNSSPLIQLYMNTKAESGTVSVTGFKAIWPPQFSGQVLVSDRMYQTNKSPNGKMSFSFQ